MILSSEGHVKIQGDGVLICTEMTCLMAAFRNDLEERFGKDMAEVLFAKIVENSKTASELIKKSRVDTFSDKLIKVLHELSEEGE